jgi:prepilin-type N-terminal cleavage/methylation domain-containing protein
VGEFPRTSNVVEGMFVMRLKHAFTLVELLVVIAIIAVLIALLLPALGRARQHALSVQCLSNLRSCGTLLYIYANQNRGYFPQHSLGSPETIENGGLITGQNGVTGLRYPKMKESLARIANPTADPALTPFSAGGLNVFYCPANFFWDNDIAGTSPPAPANTISHYPDDFMLNRGRIKYWYFGSPNPYYPLYHFKGPFSAIGQPPEMQDGSTNGTLDWRFWDTNRSGDNRDEYIVKLGDKNMTTNVLMTDHSRQSKQGASTVGFQFVHGPAKSFLNGWKNNLYGDGHAESRRPRRASFSPDGTAFINPDPGPDEVQPRWGNASGYQMW